MDPTVIGDNPDQRKEHEPAGDLKHELATPFHKRSGCRFVFSGLHIRFVVPAFPVLDSRSVGPAVGSDEQEPDKKSGADPDDGERSLS
jgi:hypothetical protein